MTAGPKGSRRAPPGPTARGAAPWPGPPCHHRLRGCSTTPARRTCRRRSRRRCSRSAHPGLSAVAPPAALREPYTSKIGFRKDHDPCLCRCDATGIHYCSSSLKVTHVTYGKRILATEACVSLGERLSQMSGNLNPLYTRLSLSVLPNTSRQERPNMQYLQSL